MAKILIVAAVGAILLSTAIIEQPSYIEAPWDNTSCWTSNTPNNPQFEITDDDELSEKAIRLYGDYVNYYFKLPKENKEALLKDKKYHYLSFSLKAENGERFIIYVSLKTTKGDRCLRYEALDYDRGREYYNQAIYGLGTNIQDGNWHTIYRDMCEDLKKIFPEEEILEVAQILFVGNLYINNVRFYKELPQNIEITRPRILKSSYEYIYNEETKQQICVRCNTYDKYGNLEFYYIKYIYYGTYDPSKEVSDKNYAQKWVWYIYNPDNNLTHVSITYYDTYQYNSKYLYYNPEMIPRCEGISRYIYKDGDWFLNSETTYFKKDGKVWYKHERKDDNYRGWKNGHRWIIYKWPDGTVFRSIYEEFIHEGRALKESYNTVYDGNGYDGNGTIISKITRYHTPESCWPYGEWYEEENFKDDEVIYTRGKIIYANSSDIQCLSECDYDKNNQIREIRLKYFNFDDLGENINKVQILYYDNKGKLKYSEEKILNPWNSIQGNIIRAPEILEQNLIKTEIIIPDSEVIDNDFQSKGTNPYWKPLANESGVFPIYKKEKIDIDGKTQKALRIEKPHEEEETGPVFVQQYVPISGGEHKLVLKYQRLTGKAIIRGEWIPIDGLCTTEELDTITLFEEVDDSNEGLQDIEIPFITPDEPGILILNLGAASVVVYSHIELDPPEPLPLPPLPDQGTWQEPPKIDPIKPPEPPPVIHPILPPEPEKCSEETKRDLGLGDNDKRMPVAGGYIIFVYNDKEKKVKDIDSNIISDIDLLPPPEEIFHIRTYRGDMIKKALEEKGISMEEIREREKDYSAEFVIASEDGSSQTDRLNYGWRVKGPGVDSIYSVSNGEKLYPISKQKVEEATIAPKSPLAHKKPEIKEFKYYTQGIINLIKGKLKEFLLSWKLSTST